MLYERTLAIGQRFADPGLDSGRATLDADLGRRAVACPNQRSQDVLRRCSIAAIRSSRVGRDKSWCFLLVHEPRGVTVAHK